MSTGKQQQQFSNGRGNGDPTTIDIDPSSTSHADVPPPAYSSTLERVGKQDERSPLLGSGVPSSSSPSVMRNLTPAMEAARRAIDPSSQQRSCVTGLRQRWRELWQRFVWWWDDSWLAMKGFFQHYKGHLIAAVVSILLIWGLIRIYSHLSYECKIPEDAEIATMEYSFDPADYREFFFHLDEGITGDISVSQSRDRIESNVTILITAQGSTSEMLSAMSLKFAPSQRSSFLETNIFLNMASSKIRAALARNCTRVEVDIIFPRRLLDYDLIQLESNYAGNVQVRMDPKGAGTAVVERLEIMTRSGSVSVKDLVVSEAMNILSKDNKGKVEVQVEAMKVVRVQGKSEVVLDLESHTNMLDVIVNTSSYTQVTMKTPFYGHLWLKTTSYFDRPELFAMSCCFYQQMMDNHSLVGYMSFNGYEPGYLPRIDAKGYSTRLNLL